MKFRHTFVINRNLLFCLLFLLQQTSNFYFIFQSSLLTYFFLMSNTSSLMENYQTIQQHQPKGLMSHLPLKFKAMILKSIYDKHRCKELHSKRKAFFIWYIQKNDNQLIKDQVDRVLIAQNQSKFTGSRFFYRMKYFIRKEVATLNQLTDEQSQKMINQDRQKQKSSNSEIKQRQNSPNKNFADYFDSLKNIFSVKLIQCQNQQLSKSLINEKDEKNSTDYYRFKTQGCELGTSINNSLKDMSRVSIQRGQKMLQLEHKQTEIQRKYCEIEERQIEMDKILLDKVNNVKQLGKKVSLTLMRSFITNKQRQTLCHTFNQLLRHCQHSVLTQQTQLNQIKNFQFITKQSSQIHIQTQSNASTSNSQSFLQTQRSSQSSLPPLTHINHQISHVEYQISLLSQTIKKDNDMQELYKQFQAQFGDYEAIEKEFQLLRVKTRNSIFDRLINVKKKLQKWLLNQAFCLIKQSNNKKLTKINNENLSRSRVNISTLHSIFSKPLVSLSNQANNKQDCRSQVDYSMTSIKMICDRNANTDSKFYKPQSRGVIKKQALNFDKSSASNEFNSEMNSTFGQNCFKEKPTAISQNPSISCKSTSKSHVNFVLPQTPASSKWSTKPKKTDVLTESMNDGFRKKVQNKMNSTGFYEISMKSFESNSSSSPSTKYHAQIKSQYWWNELEEKQNLAFREGEQLSRSSHSSIENQDKV